MCSSSSRIKPHMQQISWFCDRHWLLLSRRELCMWIVEKWKESPALDTHVLFRKNYLPRSSLFAARWICMFSTWWWQCRGRPTPRFLLAHLIIIVFIECGACAAIVPGICLFCNMCLISKYTSCGIRVSRYCNQIHSVSAQFVHSVGHFLNESSQPILYQNLLISMCCRQWFN